MKHKAGPTLLLSCASLTAKTNVNNFSQLFSQLKVIWGWGGGEDSAAVQFEALSSDPRCPGKSHIELSTSIDAELGTDSLAIQSKSVSSRFS